MGIITANTSGQEVKSLKKGVDSDGIQSFSTVLIFQSIKRPGLIHIVDTETANNSAIPQYQYKIAPDMLYSDETEKDLLSKSKKYEKELQLSAEGLFTNWESFAKTVSTGEVQKVAQEMIKHFKEKNGIRYENEELVKIAKEHKSTKVYKKLLIKQIVKELKDNNGDITKLRLSPTIYQYIQENASYPEFNGVLDIFNGLQFVIHDFWANKVLVKNFKLDGKKYMGTLIINLFDHFGLDEADMEKSSNGIKFIDLAGFRAWYILQHYDKFGGAYRPFINSVPIEFDFTGEI